MFIEKTVLKFKTLRKWFKRSPKPVSGEYPTHIPPPKGWVTAFLNLFNRKGKLMETLDKNVWNR